MNIPYFDREFQNSFGTYCFRLVVFAGDVTPVDVMCHLPAVCEEKNLPYCYIPSKQDLAHAVSFTNSCLMVLIKPNDEYAKLYSEVEEEFKQLNMKNAEQYNQIRVVCKYFKCPFYYKILTARLFLIPNTLIVIKVQTVA